MSTKLICLKRPYLFGMGTTTDVLYSYHFLTGEFSQMPNGDMSLLFTDGVMYIKESNIDYYVEFNDTATPPSGAGILTL